MLISHIRTRVVSIFYFRDVMFIDILGIHINTFIFLCSEWQNQVFRKDIKNFLFQHQTLLYFFYDEFWFYFRKLIFMWIFLRHSCWRHSLFKYACTLQLVCVCWLNVNAERYPWAWHNDPAQRNTIRHEFYEVARYWCICECDVALAESALAA